MFEYSIPELKDVPRFPRRLANKIISNTGMTSLPDFTHGSFPKILEESGFINIKSNDISPHVYLSWFHMWKFAVRFIWDEVKSGRISSDNIPGSLFIWPAKKYLGYNISQATKPFSFN